MDPAPTPQPTPTPEDPPRKANAAVVDQVQSHEGRLERLEKGFFSTLFADKAKETPPAPQQKPGTPPAPKKKAVLEELAEVADPFGMFEDPKPAPKPEAPPAEDAG